MNKWLAYLLLTGGAILVMKANGTSLSSLLGGLGGGDGAGGADLNTDPEKSAPGSNVSGGQPSIGQIGSNFIKTGSDLGTALDAVSRVISAAPTYSDVTVQTGDGSASVSTVPRTRSIPAYRNGLPLASIKVPLDSPYRYWSNGSYYP